MTSLFGKPSITRNLTWGLVLSVTLVLALFNTFFYLRSVNQIEKDLQKRADDNGVRLAGVLGAPMWNFDNLTIQQISEVYTNLDEVVSLNIQDDQGKLVYSYQKPDQTEAAIRRTEAVFYEEQMVGQVEIALSSSSIQEEQRSTLLSALLSTLMIVVAIMATNQILLRRFLNRPLMELTAGLDQIAQGKYDHRLPAFHLEDMDTIANSITMMAGQISSRDQQLRELIDTLEERVNARTHDLNVAMDVATQIATELDFDRLIAQVVDQTRTAFNLSHLFIVLQEGDFLVFRAGTGGFQEKLKETPIIIPLDAKPSLVAQAAREQLTLVVNDVTQNPAYLFLADLPETRSELAIPLRVGDQVLGVLDVQHNEPNRFAPDDVRVLSTLAGQISVAVRNARLFREVQLAREEAEKANRVKSMFLASMSHELRTPLNAILNFSHFISVGMMGVVNERQIDGLQKIQTSGQHLLNLINDVLDISKIEAGALELFVEEDVNLREEMDLIQSTGQILLKDKPVQLEIDFPDDFPLIRGDKQRITQILLNLVSNACKFTEEGRVSILGQQQNGDVLLTVKDTGPGISPAEQEKVFEIFHQTSVGLRKSGSTGLGLPISRRLAEAHFGKLWLESEVGKGASFYLLLPIRSDNLTPTK